MTASKRQLLRDSRGVQTWEEVGPAGLRLVKVHAAPTEPWFRAEFEFLSALSHPGLPRALDYRYEDREEAYVREFISGPTLAEEFGKLSPEATAVRMAQALRALAALHFRGLAHGDLSGGNILVHPRRGAVLIDFEFLSPRHQRGGKIRGTPRCMAPELFWGHPPTIQTDLYALGCVLYALIAGEYPFAADSFDALLQQHALEIPVNPAARRPGFPRELGWVALRLLAKEPAQRFADANEAIAALNRSAGTEEALEPAPPVLADTERLRAARAYSHEREALNFLRSRETPEELAALAELLLKTGALAELEALLPRLPRGPAALFTGLLLNRRGRYDEALTHLAGAPGEDPRALLGRATALYYVGKVPEALQLLRETPEAESGGRAPSAARRNLAGNFLLFERRLSEAIAAFGEALAQARDSGAAALEAVVLMNLSNAQQATGEWEAAYDNIRKARELYDALGLELERARAELNLAGTLRFFGHLEKSAAAIASAETVLEKNPNVQLQAYAGLLRTDLAKKRGDYSGALRSLADLREVLSRHPSAADRGDLWISEVECRWALGDDAGARDLLRQAREAAETREDLLFERRADFLDQCLRTGGETVPDLEKLLFAAEALREAGDVEFLLDNLVRAVSRHRGGAEILRRWALRLAESAERSLPADDRPFFRQQYHPLWEIPAMPPNPITPAPDLATADSRLASLLEWMRELTGELDLQALTEKILSRMLSFAGMERGFVILKEGERLTVMQSHRISSEECREAGDESLSWSLTRQAMTRGEPLFTANAQDDQRLALASSVRQLELRAILVLPFRLRGEVLGAVYLDSRLPAIPEARPDLAYLGGLADLLGQAIRNAERFERSVQDLEQARRALERSQEELALRYQYHNLIGRAPATRAFLQRVDRVTEVRAPVILLGESGVGKELVARAIHYNGPLQKGPFVTANCSAIPETLVESVLFGHERGAFTGALDSRPGLFEQAHRGTLFLDEIGEMPAAMQAKLLRVLQDGEVRRVGGLADRKFSVRIIAATHRDLKQEIQQGRFREDLYYRLSVAEIFIPPLRERREDIPLLVDHFLQKFAEQNGTEKKQVHPKVLGALTHYPWSGNIRELENLIYNLCIFSSGPVLLPEDLRQKPELAALLELPLPPPPAAKLQGSSPLREALDRGEINLSEAKRRFEREEIVRILSLHEGKVGEAAAHLGIPRPQLSRLLRYHRLQRPARAELQPKQG